MKYTILLPRKFSNSIFNLALLAGYDNYPAVGVFTEHPVSNIQKNRKLMVVNTKV